MPKFNHKRLAKQAAGVPAELCVNTAVGNGTNSVLVSGGSHAPTARDGLVSALVASGGSAYTDITSTATLTTGGSLNPGQDIGTDPILVFWYRFEH